MIQLFKCAMPQKKIPQRRRTLSLSLKNMTELYEISNGFTRKDWVCVGFEMSITWKLFLSFTSTPFNNMVFFMTQERENETTKTKIFTLHNPRIDIEVFQVTPISSLSKSSRKPKSSAEDIHF